jgi:ribosomal protein S18 acetylase RimI-like enzyme
MTALTATTGVAVRPMAAPDIAEVAAMQEALLEGSIVSALGPRFLTRFHAAALEHPSTRALVATDERGGISGFVTGTLDVSGFNAHVKPRVLPALVRSLLTRRGLALGWRFARTLFEPEPQPHIPAELLLLAVDRRFRRQRIGHRLVAALEANFASAGVRFYRVAVRSQLEEARAFYRALGFEPEQELLILGKPMTYLTKHVAT